MLETNTIPVLTKCRNAHWNDRNDTKYNSEKRQKPVPVYKNHPSKVMIGHEKNTGTVRNQTRSNLLEIARKIHAQSQKHTKLININQKTQKSSISTKRCQYHQKSAQTNEHVKHHESACHDPKDLAKSSNASSVIGTSHSTPSFQICKASRNV